MPAVRASAAGHAPGPRPATPAPRSVVVVGQPSPSPQAPPITRGSGNPQPVPPPPASRVAQPSLLQSGIRDRGTQLSPFAEDTPLPGDLQTQIDEARRAEAEWAGEVRALEREHAEATAAHQWDKLPDLDARLLKVRQAHATAAGQLAGLRNAARDIADAMAREAETVAAERRQADALAAQGRAIEAERAAMAALDARLKDFWGLVAAAQQAFAEAGQIEHEVRQHRQAANDATAAVHGQTAAVRAQTPGKTSYLRDYKPGVRELLELRP